MKQIIFSFPTFNIVVRPPTMECEIWFRGMPQWYGTLEELEKLLLESLNPKKNGS